jgi:predicted DCC family thiol-disulfide oxidoreductase YuxK
MKYMDTISPVLFFDGDCILCNRAVQYVIRHDRAKVFYFSPLGSPAANDLLKDMAGVRPDTFLLLLKGKCYTRSTAALMVAKLLGGWRSSLYVLMVIPRPLRDGLYDLVARNRYKWFGRSETCLIPSPEVMNRFLDQLPANC